MRLAGATSPRPTQRVGRYESSPPATTQARARRAATAPGAADTAAGGSHDARSRQHGRWGVSAQSRRRTAAWDLSEPFHDPAAPVCRRSSLAGRFAVTHARSGWLIKLFLGNPYHATKVWSDVPDRPGPKRAQAINQLLLDHTLSEPPGQRQRRSPWSQRLAQTCSPAQPRPGPGGPAAPGIPPRHSPGIQPRPRQPRGVSRRRPAAAPPTGSTVRTMPLSQHVPPRRPSSPGCRTAGNDR